MGFFSRRPRTHTTTTTHRQNRVRGLRAATNNPRTTSKGRHHAESQLIGMHAKPNKPTLGTRLRHLFHLPAKSHGRNRATHAHTRY